MGSFHLSKRSDSKWYAVEVWWGIFIENLTRILLILKALVNIPIETLLIPPWLLLRRMIISQLELGPSVLLHIQNQSKFMYLWLKKKERPNFYETFSQNLPISNFAAFIGSRGWNACFKLKNTIRARFLRFYSHISQKWTQRQIKIGQSASQIT